MTPQNTPLFYLTFFGIVIIGIGLFFLYERDDIQNDKIEQLFDETALHYEYQHKINTWLSDDIKQAAINFETLNTNDEIHSQIINKHHPEENLFTKYECPVTCTMGCVFEGEEPMCLEVIIDGGNDEI